MKKIHLQHIGEHDAIEAKDLRPGMITVWNAGAKELVEKVEFSKTGKTVTVTSRTLELGGVWSTPDYAKGYIGTRKFRATRLVAVELPLPEDAEQTAPEADAVTPDELEAEAAPQEATPETEAAQEEEKVMTLLDVHTANARAIEDEEIVSVKVLWNDGDSWVEYADVAEAMNEFGADKAVSAWELDGTTLNVWLAQPASEDDAAITDAAAKFIFLVEKHNSMTGSAHYANLGGDSAVEMDCLKSGDRLYKAIRNSAERLRRAGMEVRLTDSDYPYYHVTGAVVKRDGAIIAAYPEEAAAGNFVVTGQCRRDLARCETRAEAETVRMRIGGFDVIPVEDYAEPETDCDCFSWNFSREKIEELAAVVAEDVNDPDPEREWDFDSIGALLAVAGFYGDKEFEKQSACGSCEELDALLMEELRETERICNVKIFTAA